MFELFEFSLYMLYGLMFMAISFTIYFRDLRFSNLSIAKALPTLAVFAFIHGLHEWSELYLIIYQQELLIHKTVKVFKVAKLWISFIALGYFALQMLTMTRWRFRSQLYKLALLITIVFLINSIFQFYLQDLNSFVHNTSEQIRWFFGSAAGILAGLSLINYSKKLQFEERQSASSVGFLGISIIVYGVFAGFLYIEDSLIGVMIRTILAGIILFQLHNTLSLFDAERQSQIERSLQKSIHNKKLRDMGGFSSSIAHEIKTPLSSALMRCDLLEKQCKSKVINSEEVNRQLNLIRKGLLSASHISQELLDFSHKKVSIFETYPLVKIVDSGLELMEHRLTNFTIEKNIAEDLCVYVDRLPIEEVIINILNNAIDACTEEKLIIIQAKQKGMRVQLEIIDSGSGINEKILGKVMQPFFTTKDKSKGTGLGLTVCQSIIEQHNGSLYLSNSVNGLQVTIELPMEGV
jgi:signal transduction histidine kinase